MNLYELKEAKQWKAGSTGTGDDGEPVITIMLTNED